jgi:hypothetical protein
MAVMFRFQCPECGFGDQEVGHLVADTEIYCVVCLEEQGRLVSIHSWDEEEITALNRQFEAGRAYVIGYLPRRLSRLVFRRLKLTRLGGAVQAFTGGS